MKPVGEAAANGPVKFTVQTDATSEQMAGKSGNVPPMGYAARLIDVLSEQIAEQRAGKKWADMGAADRVSATRAAFPTAKRYAEKSVGIAKQAADKGAPVTEIANAEKDEDAAGIVRAWMLGMGCTSQDALFAAFGFAKAAGKREPKGATAKTPSEVTSATPEAPASDAQPAQAPAAEVKEADNRSVADVSRENAARFAESVRAVMAGMTDADRQFFAQTILADVQAAAYEHWIVSGWLAGKLEDQGEMVNRDICGLIVWGRCTTGQAIYMDGVIQEIARDLLN
ncbi:hypothetical protein [Burkholderia cepacia]|uniref:hypothetical protein n=1 Tax=Burkholderia cepacia TaxID=292 RepID=UPI000A47C0CB|nr:hypothetical protein [Burkholderia cepacia]